MVGRVLGERYELLEKIGEGGMSRVYRARDLLLNRFVAVKILKDQMTGDPDFIRRFRREAQSAAGLSHPNIVNIFDVGKEQAGDMEIHYIVMEYVSGHNLKEYIRERGRLSSHEAVLIARQIAEALLHAHAAGVVHRDIKPQNIIFSNGGRAKVADFGIAIAADGPTVTLGNTVIGSVHYFSPEQARGKPAGKQSDIYSLGIILYEMITGRVPYSGESPVSVAMKHVQEAITPPSELVAGIPEPLERIIIKAVQKEPSRRYPSVAALLKDLNLFLEQGKAEAEVYPLDGCSEDTIVMEDLDEPAGKERREKLWQRSWFVPVLVVLLVSSFLLAGFVLLRGLILPPPEVEVPDVRELRLEEAISILEEEKLAYTITEVNDNFVPEGYVVRTDPRAFRKVRQNSEVELFVSLGPEQVAVPNLFNYTEMEARIILQQLGLTEQVTAEYNDEVAEGRVFKQVPSEGFFLNPGEQVIIYVSLGGQPFPIASLIGRTEQQALEYLQEEELVVRHIRREWSSQPEGTVIAQYPEAGTSVQKGSAVDLVISRGDGISSQGAGQGSEEEAVEEQAP